MTSDGVADTAPTNELLAEMAREHALIAQRAADVEAEVRANRQAGALVALGLLQEIVGEHFAAEEVAMEALDYAGFEAHRAAHQEMASGLHAIHLALAAETLAHLAGSLGDYMTEAARHIAEHDEPLRAFLARHA